MAIINQKVGPKDLMHGVERVSRAAVSPARTVMNDPYLSEDPRHEGLLLHSVYHRPNGWDHIPKGRKISCGEACMWGDYHLLELAVYLKRLVEREPYLACFRVIGTRQSRKSE